MLFSKELWETYVGNVEKNFKSKTYLHFDFPFNFPKHKEELYKLLSDPTGNSIARHSFLPFVKTLIKTPRYRYQENEEEYSLETKVRPIAYASHFDAYIYSYYAWALTTKYQEYITSRQFGSSVLAYRNDLDGKCNIQFAEEVFDFVRETGECTAIALDIKGYFDHIDHNVLKEKLCNVLDVGELPPHLYKVYRSLTKYSYVNKVSVLKHFNIDLKKTRKGKNLLDMIPHQIAGKSFNDKFNYLRDKNLVVTNEAHEVLSNGKKRYFGIPQGSAMSAVLSNIYLIDFDKFVYDLVTEYGGLYRRYCDDLLVICPPEHAKYIRQEILKHIKEEYHLKIQDKKTEIIGFFPNSKGNTRSFNLRKIEDEGATLTRKNEEKYYKNLQYLGFEYNGKNIYIRSSSLSRYFRKMKGRIVKTIMMAYSSNSKSDKIFRKQIYSRYSHLGKRNFLSYAYSASKKYYKNSKGVKKEGLNSPSIRKQLSSHLEIIEKEIRKTSLQRAIQKFNKGKFKSFKS